MKYVKLFKCISYEALKMASSGKYIYWATKVAFSMIMVDISQATATVRDVRFSPIETH